MPGWSIPLLVISAAVLIAAFGLAAQGFGGELARVRRAGAGPPTDDREDQSGSASLDRAGSVDKR
jgi:hypothetical protein